MMSYSNYYLFYQRYDKSRLFYVTYNWNDETNAKFIRTQTTKSNQSYDTSKIDFKRLKFVNFLSTIDQVIVNNLQFQWRW